MKEAGVAVKATDMFDGESNLDPFTNSLYAHHAKKVDDNPEPNLKKKAQSKVDDSKKVADKAKGDPNSKQSKGKDKAKETPKETTVFDKTKIVQLE